ncbi:hypothetical protein PN465_15580 [Nodularia spumigena CS-584]|uniref:Uncharacterized protein n=1 Tax=Nodularia spumigena UHCC 0060 TaxID=3110300 RepID=A0ABU5USN5_NODSP|nr:hypothetical protein [Nodularia spumigena]AHJ27967.1 hypothetical protein NSP_16330 [Nodularia spumigena CCY9414]MDB9303140.1 hypothetical protein [Nodularia spumigena CS-591/12]MDB9383626.1 hypothetical protein [Nodularia spumigena CS-584]MEA5555300.1 hypothetical protein [Nodularia spumigena CH309]MEA5609323.1 hypothetical protein [Nodularia spumigena UHCC 0060]
MVLEFAVQVAGFKGDFSGFERSLLLAFVICLPDPSRNETDNLLSYQIT